MTKIISHEQILNATQTIKGISRFAIEQEAIDQLLNNVIISPATLKVALDNRQATEEIIGLIQIATLEEISTGTNNTKAITPVGLKSISNSLASIESPNFTGTPTISNNTIWHSGNDGTESGLDADMVDGKHLSDINNNAIVYALIFG